MRYRPAPEWDPLESYRHKYHRATETELGLLLTPRLAYRSLIIFCY